MIVSTTGFKGVTQSQFSNDQSGEIGNAIDVIQDIRMFVILWVMVFGFTAVSLADGKAIESTTDAQSFTDGIDYRDSVVSEARAGTNRIALFKSLLRRADVHRASGYYQNAETDLREAILLSEQNNNPVMQSLATGALGQLYNSAASSSTSSRFWPKPEKLLQQSLLVARRINDAKLIAIAFSRLGDWQYQSKMYPDARASFEQSLSYASRPHNHPLRVSVLTDLARVAIAMKQQPQSISYLQRAYDGVENIQSAQSRSDAYLAIHRLAESVDTKAFARMGEKALAAAVDLIPDLHHSNSVALTYGLQGAAYEQEGLYVEAQQATEMAIRLAPDAHDLALQWEWMMGRLYQREGDVSRAIDAYRRAVFHIEAIRQDIPVTFNNGQSSFRQTLSPIYMGLVDLLLLESEKESDERVEQQLLIEAQSVVERFKKSELQDFYRDACVIRQSGNIGQKLASDTAVLYPVVLPGRLAILIKLADRYHHFSVAVKSSDLNSTVRNLADELRYGDTRLHKRPARRLYKWLLEPVDELLTSSGIQTLVFVPDGFMRMVPITALWDGSRYLIEKYAVATVPGLTLLNSDPGANKTKSTLLAGLSEPGPVLEGFSGSLERDSLAYNFVSQQRRSLNRGAAIRAGQSVEPAKPDSDSRGRLQELFSLPAVEDEIEELAQQMSSSVLMNETFLLDRFKSEVLNNPYRVIHVASHGYFGNSVKDSWIMAYDQLLNMSDLNKLFKPKEFSSESIELLVLSACQTAEGDDRAPLGLSGAALTSGARSVLGSLWSVDDNATLALMSDFYKSLNNDNLSKAQALRNAQLSLLSQREYKHPFYWSAFILVGNWL